MGAVAAVGGRIEVDPEVLLRAGQRIASMGTQLDMLSGALGAALGSGIASGVDPAGLDFGLKYGHQAQDFANAVADAANAFKSVGYMLEATGYNYKNADAASTIGGSGPAGGVGGEPSKTTAGHVPAGPNSSIVPPPLLWGLLQPFLGLGLSWPSGNSALMRLTAAQWRNIGHGLSVFSDEMAALKPAVSAQHIPEGAKIGEALDTLGQKMSDMSSGASQEAQVVENFANGVQNTQDAIRRLLDRLSPQGLFDTVKGFLTGDGEKILRETAHDVDALLDNFQSQVKGIVGLLGELTTLIGDAADAFQKWIRPILVAQFGDDVGNALADAVTVYTDFQVGLVTGVIGTVSGLVSLADADTWKGMAEMALSVAEDPTKLPGVLENMGKQFVAWDQWSGDHPGRAAGEAAFNIGSLFVPGGALTKTGNLAKGLRYGSRLLEEGRLPRFSDLPGLGRGDRTLPSLDNLPGAGPGHPGVPEFHPARVPDSVVGPSAPHGVDAPTTPHGLEGPSRPPDPPGPSGGGHGSGGGPPDPPGGRPVGPPDSGPGRVDGPAPQSPSSGPGEPSHVSEPPAPSPTPSSGDTPAPVSQHTPETSSPASPHDESLAPSDPGPSPTEHGPATPDSPGNGQVAEPRGDGNYAPNEGHQPESEGYTGPSDERAHAPADLQPAHTPSAESPNGHEPPTTDGGQPREPSHVPGDADARPQETAGVAQTPMAGGMPMAPHVPGPMHGPADGHSPANRTPTPETPTRTPDPKGPQATSPEGTRAQAPAASGPAAGNMPSAPIDPPTKAAAGGAGEPLRPGPESHTPRTGDHSRDGSSTSHPTPHETPGADRPGSQPDPSGPHQNPGTGSAHNQPPNTPGPVGNPADARTYGPGELRPVEHPAYQTAVEDALRDHEGNYLVHADPRTNDYGNLINDGGPTVPGRSNNCLDSSLSALSSFRGDPTVSAPRHPDRLPDGTIDDRTGEASGLRRAADWLGGGMLEFPGQSIADQFEAVHHYVDNLGPGSSALVVNGWHARDFHTGDFLYHPDGSPVTDGAHATVVVYPEGASHPVWWDPQQGLTSDGPPSWMSDQSTYLHFTPIEPSGGVHHGGVGNQGTGAGVSGADVADRDVPGATVPERMGGHESSDPRTDAIGRGGGVGPPGDRFGDGDRLPVSELVVDDGGRGPHDGQTDGRQAGPSDLSVSVDDHGAAHSGERTDDRVSDDGGITDRSAGTDTTPSAHDREAHVGNGSDGLAVERGDVPRGVGEPSEPGRVAGGGHEPGVGGHDPDRSDGGGGDPRPTHATGDEHAAGSHPDTHGDNQTHERSSQQAADQPNPDSHAAPKDPDGTTQDDSGREPHSGDAASDDHHPGSPWDGETGQHAAELLPADDSGYRIQPRDCEFLGISPEQVEAWAHREAPLGMTPTEFRDFSNSLYDALAREGFNVEDLDLRLQGSSARFFSGEHKSLPLESDLLDNPEAQARMDSWLGDGPARPLRRPFDSMHRLGLDDEPSDYDLQISSDSMVDACRQKWEADGSHGSLVNHKYGFIVKETFGDMFPSLWEWADQWTARTGRPVVPALFPSSGPPDTSLAGVSSHFRESDWRIQPDGSDSQ